jgi:hypothetical protein
MKNAAFKFGALALLLATWPLTAAFAQAEDTMDKKSWAALIDGKNNDERWQKIGKAAPHMLGMTRAEVEKALGKGTYSDKQQEMFYQITESADGKSGVFDNLSISFDRDGHVFRFVTVSKAKN